MSIIYKLRTNPKIRKIAAAIYSLFGHSTDAIKSHGY